MPWRDAPGKAPTVVARGPPAPAPGALGQAHTCYAPARLPKDPSMAEFLYRLRLARPGMFDDGGTPDEQSALADHFTYLERLHGDGVVRLAGRTTTKDERAFGIVVFQADGNEAARDIMNADPAIEHGVMRATLHPFRIALG